MAKAAIVVGVLFVAVLVAGLPSFARAAEVVPTVEGFTVDETIDVASCGSFDVIRHEVAKVIVITYFDSSGDPVRVGLHINENSTVSNSVTGQSLRFLSILNIVIDLTDGTVTVNGAPFVMTLVYGGIVIQDTGRLVTDSDGNWIFEAGSHDFGPNGDFTRLCPLLQ